MSVQIDIEGNFFVLQGGIDAIRNRRRAKSNFESIGGGFELDKIYVEFSTDSNPGEFDSQELQYRALIRLLDKFQIEYHGTKKSNEFSELIDKENELFKTFSIKARNIRNNIHETGDFKQFTNIISTKLERELYTLQLVSAYHLAFSQNACNFSVPGAGKTSVVYAAYSYLKNLPREHIKHVDRLLIISPLAAFGPWKDEYKECFGHETTIKKLVGVSKKDRQNHFYSDNYTEVTLISYQSASNEQDIENIVDYLKRYKVMVVLDEAHKIKNTDDGKIANAILSLAKYAASRVVLTGTPVPNGYQDLYNLYKFIWPEKDVLGYPLHYLQNLSKNFTPGAQGDVEKLVDNISPFFIRIKKGDFPNLPDAIYNKPILIPMSSTQRTIYDFIEKKYIDSFENDSGTQSFTLNLKKAKLIRLMQCVTNPRLLKSALNEYLNDTGDYTDLDIDDREIVSLLESYYSSEEIPPKFIEAYELIKKIISKDGADGKVIVWSLFIQNILEFQKYLSSKNIKSELLYGSTPKENEDTPTEVLTREKIIRDFHNEDCDYKVIIANPFAVGESISLHHACHNAIYMEKNFNAAMYMQSKDRIHRYGLLENDEINYYYLVTENSIDETIHRRVLEKETRMLEVIERDDIPLLNLNMDEEDGDEEEGDIKALIRDYHARKNS